MNLRKRPLIIAHRGNSSECPENTFEAFESALACGADGIDQRPELRKKIIRPDPSGAGAEEPFGFSAK